MLGGVSVHQNIFQVSQRNARIENILNQQYIAAVRVNIKVLFEFNNARSFGSAVRGYRHKIDLTVAGYRAH